MRTHTKTMLAAIAATLILTLALASASATARNFSLSEKEFEMLFRELQFEAASNRIRCPFTLLGHFLERTIPKVLNSRVGVINHVEPRTAGAPPCTGGTITILTETLPWRIDNAGFTGRLPEIETIRYNLIGIAFRLTPSGQPTCLAGTTIREPLGAIQRIGAGGRVEEIRADETRLIRLGGGFLCEIAGSSSFSGIGTILNLPGTRPIFVTLI